MGKVETSIREFFQIDAKSAWYRVKNKDEILIYFRIQPQYLWCPDNNKYIRNLILDYNNLLEIIQSGYRQAAKTNQENLFWLVVVLILDLILRILNCSEIQNTFFAR